MKNYLFVTLFNFVGITLFSQVGIQTTNPTETLDVNGTLRVRKITQVGSSAAAKDSIMVFDSDGVVKRVTASQIVSQASTGNSSVLTDGTTIIGNGSTGNEIKLAQQGATINQFLGWNGTNWVPISVSNSETLTSITDNNNGTFTYIDEDNSSTIISKSNLVDNGNGSFTFNNGSSPVVFQPIANGTIYNNINSGLAATNVQSAIDQLKQIITDGTLIAGNGLTNVSGNLNVNVDDSSIFLNASNSLAVKDSGITSAKIADSNITLTKIASGGANKVLVTDPTGNVAWLDKTSLAAAVADGITIEGNGTTANPFKVKDLSITTTKLADNSVTTLKIIDSNVTTNKINNLAITNNKIADNAITSAKITDASVTTLKIADSNVTLAKIASGGTNKVLVTDATGNVAWLDKTSLAAAVADGITIEGDGTTSNPFKVKDLSITTTKLADNSVTTLKIANANVTTDKIADLAISNNKIEDNAITSAKVINKNITFDKLEDGISLGNILNWNGTSWVSTGINSSSVTGKDLTSTDSSITISNGLGTTLLDTNFKVSELGITNAKLADDAITTSKIQNGAVTTVDIADLSITNLKIADDAITSVKIIDGEVKTADIATDAIDKTKIASNVAGIGLIKDADGSLKVDVSALNGDGSITSTNSSILVTGTPANSILENVNLAVNTDNSTIEVNSSGNIQLKDGGITSTKIQDATILTSDIAQNGANPGDVLEWTGTSWVPVTRVKTVNGVMPTSNGNVAVVLSRVATGLENSIGNLPSFLVPNGLASPLVDGDIYIVNGEISPNQLKNGITYIFDDQSGWNKVNTDFTQNDVRYLNTTGDNMTGTLNMTNNAITGISAPINNSDATNKQYVDNLLSSSASGSINSPNGSVSLSGIPTNSTFKNVGFDVNVDNSTIQIAATKVQVKDLGITTSKIADDAVDRTKIAPNVAGAGLSQATDGSLQVNATNISLSGDVNGTVANSKVVKIQNIAVSNIAPTNNQLLKYNSATSQWEAANENTDVVTNYTDNLSVTKNKIGSYTNELGIAQNVNETVTRLSISNGALAYSNENASNANVPLISIDANNSMLSGSDGRLFVKNPTGEETKINSGTNISITGSGTIANPYVVNNSYTNPDNDATNELNTSLTSSLNTLKITDAGGDKTASIINTNILNAGSNKLVSTINGITSELIPITGVIANEETLGFDSSGNLVRGSSIGSVENGLTKNLNKIELGGAITKPTTISGITNTNKLSLTASGIDAINIDSNTFSLDADSNRVGFGTATPGNTVEIVGTPTNSGLRLSSITTKGLLGTNSNGDIIAKPTISNELYFENGNFYYISMKIETNNYKVVRYNKNDVNEEKNSIGSGTQPSTLTSVQSLTYN